MLIESSTPLGSDFLPERFYRLLDRILNIWSLVSGCNGISLVLKTSCSGSTLLIWQCPTLLSRIHKLVRLSTGRVCCSQWRILCRKWAYWRDPLWLRETINQLVRMCKLNVYRAIPHTMWVKYYQKKTPPILPHGHCEYSLNSLSTKFCTSSFFKL